jgi:hypothetical protein
MIDLSIRKLLLVDTRTQTAFDNEHGAMLIDGTEARFYQRRVFCCRDGGY